MNSMTGFGRAAAEREGYRLTVELKSVNHRFLDMNIRMPRTMLFLEDTLRSILKSKLTRGHVDAFVNLSCVGASGRRVSADSALIDEYAKALRSVRKRVKLKDDLSLSTLLRIPDAVQVSEAEADETLLSELLTECVNAAADELVAKRAGEGAELIADILSRTAVLEELCAKVAARKDTVIDEYRQKLTQRLTEALAGTEIDSARLAQDVLMYADRQDITEETVRAGAHLRSLRETLASETAQGRQLDFIVQELNREFNTMGSKSADMEITNAVIAGKSEIEKIREQVQNLE